MTPARLPVLISFAVNMAISLGSWRLLAGSLLALLANGAWLFADIMTISS